MYLYYLPFITSQVKVRNKKWVHSFLKNNKMVDDWETDRERERGYMSHTQKKKGKDKTKGKGKGKKRGRDARVSFWQIVC